MNLQHKRFILTGATGGIGRCIAANLAQKGCSIILVGRDETKLVALKQSLAMSEKHSILIADLSNTLAIQTLGKQCAAMVDDNMLIDGVINNAGINTFDSLDSRDDDAIEAELYLNLLAPMLLTKSALSWSQKPHIILNIGSTFGSIGYPGYSTYCAAKAGLHRFSEAMQRELQGSATKILYLAPRATTTELNNANVTALNHQLGNAMDSPEVVALNVIKVLEKEHTTTWIGWPEKLFVKINQLFPALVSSSIRKQHAVIVEFMKKPI
ncbi:MAG: short-subunit dehydrogenase [Moritella dasanensis]|jgi:short-subunit dehydrogenase